MQSKNLVKISLVPSVGSSVVLLGGPMEGSHGKPVGFFCENLRIFGGKLKKIMKINKSKTVERWCILEHVGKFVIRKYGSMENKSKTVERWCIFEHISVFVNRNEGKEGRKGCPNMGMMGIFQWIYSREPQKQKRTYN